MNSKIVKYALCIFVFFICQSFFISTDVDKTIIGKWVYLHSIVDNKQRTLDYNKFCPVEKMIFTTCDDKNELNKMPVSVREMRKGNILKNISCETYNNDSLIDKYYPVAKENGTLYFVTNYGLHFKTEYYIEKINSTGLIIYDDKNYTINGESYSAIRHLYIKIK